MNHKRVWLGALVATLLGMGVGRGEEPQGPYSGLLVPSVPPAPVAPAPSPGDPAPVPSDSHGMPTLPSWLTYTQQGCCGPVGRDGPIGNELYLRIGPSLPAGGKVFDHVLTTGWDIQGGGRLLLFNTEKDAAWVGDLSISNIANQGQHSDIKITLHDIIVQQTNSLTGQATGTRIPTAQVTVQSLNRTFVNTGFGRDWWLTGSAYSCNCQPVCRFGIDGGGRYGSGRVEFHELHHRQDTMFGAYAGLHTDLEIPWGCAVLVASFRAEWDYTWMSILQDPPNNSNLMDLNLLFSVGARW